KRLCTDRGSMSGFCRYDYRRRLALWFLDMLRPTWIAGNQRTFRRREPAWLGDGRVNRGAGLGAFSRHCAVADHQKNQDEKEYPNGAGEVPLIEISHL